MGLQRRIEILANDIIAGINKLNAIINSISKINDELLKKIIKTKCNKLKFSQG